MALKTPAEFYDSIRQLRLFGPTLDQSEVSGTQQVLDACAKAKWPIAYTAYALATAYHETAHKMQPIKEFGGDAYFTRRYDIAGTNPARARAMGNTARGDGSKYAGRGYVQLTWKVNYIRAGKALGVDLVNKPDLAMNPLIAADIMIRGMQEGWFTAKKLSDYLPAVGIGTSDGYRRARRIINGTDKDVLIAEYAKQFEVALVQGGWS